MAIDVVSTVLYSGMMGVVASSLVRSQSAADTKQGLYLCGLLVLLLIHILGELYIFSGFYRYAPSIAGFQFPVRMLLGPALYFYAATAMFPNEKITLKKHLLALSGGLVILLLMIPFMFFISPAQKLALADPATRDPDLWRIALTTCLVTAVLFIAFTFTYLAATFRLHARHRIQLMNKYSAIEQRAMDWLKVLLILWGFVWFIYAVNYATNLIGINWFALGSVLPLIELVVLISFTHFAIKQLELAKQDKEPEPVIREREAVISEEKMAEISQKLIATMKHQALYKDEDLSLNRLSTAVSVSENYISETLSQFMKTNFFQFVNNYRVEEAKQLLINSDMLVSTIAYEVGFKSKSTFNAAFKKVAGETPTAFKKSFLDKKATN